MTEKALQNKLAREERKRFLKAEREAQLTALRQIRDNPKAEPETRFRAIELLLKMTGGS